MTGQRFSLEIGSTLDEVRRAAAWMREAMQDRLDEETAGDLELAMVEALTNIVRHAYPDGARQPIWIAIDYAPGKLDLVLRDRGQALPDGLLEARALPPSPDELALEDLPESGQGLLMIQGCVDQVAYVRDGDFNQMTLSLYGERVGKK